MIMTDMMMLGWSGMIGSTPFVRFCACENYVNPKSVLFYVRELG